MTENIYFVGLRCYSLSKAAQLTLKRREILSIFKVTFDSTSVVACHHRSALQQKF